MGLEIGRVSIGELSVGYSRARGQGDIAIEAIPNQKLEILSIFKLSSTSHLILHETRSEQMFEKRSRIL